MRIWDPSQPIEYDALDNIGFAKRPKNFSWVFFYPQYFDTYALGKSIAVCQYIYMVCIYCSGPTQVTNTRPQKKRNQIWRRRLCLKCQAIFTSIETAHIEQSWLVKQATGKLSPFLPDKLYLSIFNSLKHRESAIIDARNISDTVIAMLLNRVEDGIINYKTIADITKVSLNRFDKVASIQYQAFHQL